MKINFGSLKRMFISLLPANSQLLYRLCKRYIDLYNNENNGNIETNGELRFMKGFLPKCRQVFDIGANLGNWANLALKINPHINLHCFEPSQFTYQRLLANHFPPNVICNHLGLSSSPGEANLLIFEEGAGINSLYQRQGLEKGWGLSAQRSTEKIRLETMDRYCKSRGIQGMIDFCKVDVEGHELEVFKGMTALIENRQIKIIQFEYGGCNIDSGVLLKDIFNFFKRFDYSFFKIYPNNLRPILQYDQRLENFQYQNWVIMANALNESNLGL